MAKTFTQEQSKRIYQQAKEAGLDPNRVMSKMIRQGVVFEGVDMQEANNYARKTLGPDPEEFRNDIRDTRDAISSNFEEARENIQDQKERRGPLGRVIGALSQTSRAAARTVGDTFLGGAKAALPQGAEDFVSGNFQESIEKSNIPKIISFLEENMDSLRETNPRIAQTIDDLGGFAELGAEFAGASALKAPLGRVAKSAKEGGSQATSALSKTVRQVPELVQSSPVGVVTEPIVRGVKNIPDNVGAVVQRQADFAKLPKPVKKAVRGGVEERDVLLVADAQPAERQAFNQMRKMAEEFEKSRGATPPSDFVGTQFRSRLDELAKARTTTGQQLGEIAKGLDSQAFNRTTNFNNIFSELKQSISGLKVTREGKLDFSDTALASARSRSARKDIQQAVNEALTKDNALRLHRFRQELFEDLGGKRSSGIKLTSSQEDALEAIRKGSAKTIEDISPEYRTLNQKYAVALDIEKNLRKKFGNIADEDIFDAKAGTIMRRITSNAPSGQDIRALIQDAETFLIDNEGVVFDVPLETLQDFSNALNRYYDISKDTSLQGIITDSVTRPRGGSLITRTLDVISDATKPTADTARKSFDDLFVGN